MGVISQSTTPCTVDPFAITVRSLLPLACSECIQSSFGPLETYAALAFFVLERRRQIRSNVFLRRQLPAKRVTPSKRVMGNAITRDDIGINATAEQIADAVASISPAFNIWRQPIVDAGIDGVFLENNRNDIENFLMRVGAAMNAGPLQIVALIQRYNRLYAPVAAPAAAPAPAPAPAP